MSLLQLDIAIQLEGLDELERRLQDLGPLMQVVANHFEDVSKESFLREAQPTPFGWVPWQPLSDYTAKSRAARGYPAHNPILHVTGELENSLEAVVSGHIATLSSSSDHSAIHMTGDKGLSGERAMPARPFMGIAPHTEDVLVAAVRAHLF